jgi:hypothetical protein
MYKGKIRQTQERLMERANKSFRHFAKESKSQIICC